MRRTCPIWEAEACSKGSACHAGQDLDYLLRLLRGFKAKTMTTATQPLTDSEIFSLVHFIASLGAAP